MVLSPHFNTRENNKFCLTTLGLTAVRVCLDTADGADPLATSEKKTAPLITHVTAPLANTEYSHTLRDKTKNFILKADKIARVKYGWNSGDSATDYFPVGKGGHAERDGVWLSGTTIYFQTDRISNTVIIEEWL